MSQRTGRRPALSTAAGTEKQVYAGITTSRLEERALSAISVSVSAALPDETVNT